MDGPRRILYIEDNPANFRLVERLLRDEGFEVLHAQDGFQGVQRAVEERDRLELILMDINLPGMDGYEAATKLKNIQGFESIPIVALTVNALKGDRKRSLACGCDGYIAKPIDIHSFPQKIKEYIRGKRERLHASEERYYLREHTRKLVNRLESSLDQLKLHHDQIRHKDKLASLGEMAAGVAHELNNPLSSISFSVQLLLRDTAEGSRERQQLERVLRNVERIQKLAEGLTSFARPSDTQKTVVDVAKVLSEALALSEHEFRSRGIRAVQEIAPELPPVWASESPLHHVFLNLLRNAAQAVAASGERNTGGGSASQRGGVVFMKAQPASLDSVSVRVTDDGVGIPAEYQDRLFTPFFTTKPRGEGTGLGLYIVKEIVSDLGGRIEVESTVGKGTTFEIFLPRMQRLGEAV
ncbi:MAG: response regulator [Deltaproteobacteria bacterium]|nr:response regulator [Deltaproteobacteria bacterium]